MMTAMPQAVHQISPDSILNKDPQILVQEVEVPLTPITIEKQEPSLTSPASDEESQLLSSFEAAIAPGTITTQAITTCLALTSHYESHSRWADAVAIYRRVLASLWPAFEAPEAAKPGPLPTQYPDVCVSTATKLAAAYRAQGLSNRARLVYCNLFRACRAALPLDSAKVFMAMDQLAKFYADLGIVDDLVGLYEEMLYAYETGLGKGHRFTVDVQSRMVAVYGYEVQYQWR